MIEFLGIWSFLGYVAAILSRVPKGKKAMWIYLFSLGPLSWLVFMFVSMDLKYRGHVKNNELQD